jgi:hypothetical protein
MPARKLAFNAKRTAGAMFRTGGETKVNERILIRNSVDLDAIERQLKRGNARPPNDIRERPACS